VYRHGLRKLHSFKRGKWSEKEERRLMELVAQSGPKWVKFQEELNRSADACRDKHRELSTGVMGTAWGGGEGGGGEGGGGGGGGGEGENNTKGANSG